MSLKPSNRELKGRDSGASGGLDSHALLDATSDDDDFVPLVTTVLHRSCSRVGLNLP